MRYHSGLSLLTSNLRVPTLCFSFRSSFQICQGTNPNTFNLFLVLCSHPINLVTLEGPRCNCICAPLTLLLRLKSTWLHLGYPNLAVNSHEKIHTLACACRFSEEQSWSGQVRLYENSFVLHWVYPQNRHGFSFLMGASCFWLWLLKLVFAQQVLNFSVLGLLLNPLCAQCRRKVGLKFRGQEFAMKAMKVHDSILTLHRDWLQSLHLLGSHRGRKVETSDWRTVNHSGKAPPTLNFLSVPLKRVNWRCIYSFIDY